MSQDKAENQRQSLENVIHVFPQGGAVVGQLFTTNSKHLTANSKDTQSTSFEENLAASLLSFGILTPAQHEVALLDQEATGLPLIEVLILRGWLSGINGRFKQES